MDTKHNITLYSQLEPQLITNTLVETSFFNDTNCIGSRNLASWFDVPGRVLRAVTRAAFTCVGNPINTIKIKLGGVDLITSITTLVAHTNTYAEIQVELSCVAVSAPNILITCMGRTYLANGVARPFLLTTPFAVPQGNKIFDITYQWGAADPGNILNNVSSTIQLIH